MQVTPASRERRGREGSPGCRVCLGPAACPGPRETAACRATPGPPAWAWRGPWDPRALMVPRDLPGSGSRGRRGSAARPASKVRRSGCGKQGRGCDACVQDCAGWLVARARWVRRDTASSARRCACRPTQAARRRGNQGAEVTDMATLHVSAHL